MATFDSNVAQETVLERYGPGYYNLKSMIPRIDLVWKGQLGPNGDAPLQALEKKTKYLTYGVVGVAATQIVGFLISAWEFLQLIARVCRLEVVMQAFKPDLNCPTCGFALDYFLQPFCSHCGSPITWPDKHLPSKSSAPSCLSCSFPLQARQVFCPNCGRQLPIPVEYKFKPVETRVFTRAEFVTT